MWQVQVVFDLGFFAVHKNTSGQEALRPVASLPFSNYMEKDGG
ncbi:hypothetical protein [Aneurinibacillus migulanus]|nr:hypothetical protein [Aneurinibacillus migulanus]MED0892958.1 hypothetical protein [Aneurinibacillus migulanus]MED1619204.1 hypothetical protein [Aneurinibacillus migulanus]MED4727937.1 hypothetical protein [Aneurinibacillus migulanus]